MKQMDRGYIFVNKSHLVSNLNYLSDLTKKELCLVVKANAYGHGIQWTVKTAEEAGISWFAVASVNEAIQVRNISKGARILLLAEPSKSQIKNVLKNEIDLTVYNEEFIDELINVEGNLNVHLKVDTGMHRIGCEPENFDKLMEKIQTSSLNLVGICTHFPTADTDEQYTQSALNLFKALISGHDTDGLLLHVDNSASSFYNSDDSFNMTRIGLAAYGTQISIKNYDHNLMPTMEIKTRISNLQKRNKGDAVSYGKSFELERDSTIATAPIGYGDGYPWNSFPDGYVLVNNKICKLIGRVTMDQILIDVTDIEVKVDDEVTVLGKSENRQHEITVTDIAQWNKTIEWEILTNMSRRLERIEIE